MATAVPSGRTQMLGMADALRLRAEALQQQRIELLREASRLEREANARPVEYVTVAPRSMRGREIPVRELERVMAAVEKLAPCSTPELADELDLSDSQALKRLQRLEDLGNVRRTGLRRTTRWHVAEQGERSQAPAHGADYRTRIRDAARELGTFTIVDLKEKLSDVSEMTIRNHVRFYEGEGVFAAERVGTAKLYEYVPPERQADYKRPAYSLPEHEAVRTFQVAPRRGSANVTSGRGMRTGSKIVNELIREAKQYGVEVDKSKHRVEFRKDGVIIATSSTTPAASALGGTRKQLRDAGVPVAG